MFLGLFTHSIDAKGRLNIPKRFLEPFKDPERARMFFVTRGLDGQPRLRDQLRPVDPSERVDGVALGYGATGLGEAFHAGEGEAQRTSARPLWKASLDEQ